MNELDKEEGHQAASAVVHLQVIRLSLLLIHSMIAAFMGFQTKFDSLFFLKNKKIIKL